MYFSWLLNTIKKVKAKEYYEFLEAATINFFFLYYVKAFNINLALNLDRLN